MFSHKVDASINTIDKVKQFIEIVSKYGEVNIMVLGKDFCIDGKSIMGLFSLDITKNLNMVFKSYNCDEINNVLKELRDYNLIT